MSTEDIEGGRGLRTRLLRLHELFPGSFDPLPITPLPTLMAMRLYLGRPRRIEGARLRLRRHEPERAPGGLEVPGARQNLKVAIVAAPELARGGIVFRLDLRTGIRRTQTRVGPIILWRLTITPITIKGGQCQTGGGRRFL